MKKQLFLFSTLSLIFLASCNNASTTDTESDDKDSTSVDSSASSAAPINYPESYEEGNIKIYRAPRSLKYSDAKLSLAGLSNADGPISFDFEVEKYELGVQTSDAEDKGLANSPKGQHIHLIVDNGPYSAHYEPDFTKEFEIGHHVAIAFLSRSYHESVKEAAAHQVFQFNSGDSVTADIDLSGPMLFYSRPKGTYKGKGTEKVLLDFFLKNTSIGEGGNYVQVTINDAHTFNFDVWQPYLIEGLSMGENTINIQLLDVEGNLIESPMNNVTRTFTLAEEVEVKP